MENELRKLAAAMRDMSDMVGDHHWRAAKAIEQLAQRDAELKDARRTAEYWKAEHLAGNERIAALESQQAASVGGERQFLGDLRDDIAIAAMQGLVARPFSKDERDRPFVLWVAEVSYEFADAMLAERAKQVKA